MLPIFPSASLSPLIRALCPDVPVSISGDMAAYDLWGPPPLTVMSSLIYRLLFPPVCVPLLPLMPLPLAFTWGMKHVSEQSCAQGLRAEPVSGCEQ